MEWRERNPSSHCFVRYLHQNKNKAGVTHSTLLRCSYSLEFNLRQVGELLTHRCATAKDLLDTGTLLNVSTALLCALCSPLDWRTTLQTAEFRERWQSVTKRASQSLAPHVVLSSF